MAESPPLDALQQDMDEPSHFAKGHIENGQSKAKEDNEEELLEKAKDMFARTLKIKKEKVKIEEAFLAQGGDSSLAIQIVGRCREAGFKFDTSDLLRTKTLEQMCYDIIKGTLSSSATVETEVSAPALKDWKYFFATYKNE